ncbi:MAG: hypothetical protein KA785_02020 [Spirochaetaceae bacterium]|nr:hypothetical protein [Spirochaetaceae bacterium]
MKTKTALIRAFFFLTASVLLLVLYGVFLPRVLYGAISVSLEKNEMESAYKLTDIMIRFFPSHEKTQDLILSSLPFTDGIDAVYKKEIVITAWGGSTRYPQISAVRKDDAFGQKIVRVAEAQKMEMWKWNIYERYGCYLTSTGSFKDAETVLIKAEEGFEKLNSFFRARMAYYHLAGNERARGNKEGAFDYLSIAGSEKFDECSNTDGVLAELGHLYLEKGMLDEAEVCFQKTIKEIEDSRAEIISWGEEPFDLEIQSPWLRSRSGLKMIETLRSKNESVMQKNVSGLITYNGKPLAGVSAYLMPYDEKYMALGPGTGSDENNFQTVSGSDGLLNFYAVPDGTYRLVLGFYAYQLQDAGKFYYPETVTIKSGEKTEFNIQIYPKFKVITKEIIKPGYEKAMQFSWEPVENAAEYEVWLFVKTKDITYSHPIASARDLNYTLLIPDEDSLASEFSLNPEDEPILAATVTIQAVDKYGHILTDSAGLVYDANEDYPIIFLK